LTLAATALLDGEHPLCRELTAKLDAEKGITDNPLLADSPPNALEPPAAAPDADAAADVPAEANGAPAPSEAEPTPEQQVCCSAVRHPPVPHLPRPPIMPWQITCRE